MFWNKKKKNDDGEVVDTQKIGMLQRLAVRNMSGVYNLYIKI